MYLKFLSRSLPEAHSSCKLRVYFYAFAYQVALQADKLHPGLQVPVGAASQNLDELHQICTELVSSLQDAQHHDLTVLKVLHDVPGQALYP